MLTLLIRLGLAEKEARVYLALLELAKETVINISKKSGLRRATTYVILNKLIGLGLVSQLDENGKTYFVAEDPRELENILDRAEKEIELKRQDLKGSIQQLVALHNRQPEKPIVRYYEGMDGLIALDRYGKDLPETMREKYIYGFANFDALESAFPERRKEAVNERVKARIKARTIYTRQDGPVSPEADKKALRESIWLNKKYLPFKGSIAIHDWGIKVYELGSSKAHGILIEDQQVALIMQSLMRLAWLGAEQESKK